MVYIPKHLLAVLILVLYRTIGFHKIIQWCCYWIDSSIHVRHVNWTSLTKRNYVWKTYANWNVHPRTISFICHGITCFRRTPILVANFTLTHVIAMDEPQNVYTNQTVINALIKAWTTYNSSYRSFRYIFSQYCKLIGKIWTFHIIHVFFTYLFLTRADIPFKRNPISNVLINKNCIAIFVDIVEEATRFSVRSLTSWRLRLTQHMGDVAIKQLMVWFSGYSVPLRRYILQAII